MDKTPTFKTEKVRNTQHLIADIEMLINRIKLLRIQIALHLISPEVTPFGGNFR